MHAISLLAAAALAVACGDADQRTVVFDLGEIGDDGLIGPPDGRRAVHFEFCIPADPEAERAVRAIDPGLEVHHGSRGRIGCAPDQWLCLGSTHRPRWREVLEGLAALPYVTRIHRSDFE